ncbi:MAG: sugar transferase [Actinomycetota bacterium]|nr:sugar transferase [Actinomycetota bacterium]
MLDYSLEELGEEKVALKPYVVVKRVVDILLSSSALMLLTPLMLMVGFVIKLSSPGPLFFRQKRVGLNGQTFNILKFRTMVVDAEDVLHDLEEFQQRDEPFVQLKKDPRIFPFGQILRKTSIDELPQLINILWGEMSIVGPRPLISFEVAHCDKDQLRRLEVKPGLTGLAQINGRNDASFGERMELDLEYARNRSFRLDLKIIMQTALKVLRGEGAY